jgi:MutS domain V
VTVHDVLAQYEGRLLELQTAIAQFRLPHAVAASILTIAIGLSLALGLYAIRGQVSFLWTSLPILIAAASARRLQLARQSESRMWRLKRFHDRAIQRVKGNWPRSGIAGEEFSDAAHVYTTDLHVFGEGSLFELLCIARTSIGRRGLANYLLDAPVLEETLQRQEAVRELRGRVDLREKVATLGEFEFLESRDDTFEEWLNSPRLSVARFLPVIAAVTAALLAAIVLAGLLGVIPWIKVAIWISPLLVFHAGVGLFFRSRVNGMADWLRPVSMETRVLREGIHLLEGEKFQSTKLRRIAEQVQNGSRSIRILERLLLALELRDRDPWFYGPSLVLLAGTQLCMAVERWRREHGQSLRAWVQAWAEFEALNALAAYGYENPDNTFPELTEGEACFQAHDLGHPLLPRATCVANDIELTRESPFYVVSGSNMSGKSTLLRAIGLNAVLAFAGAPVRARALRLSELSVIASLSIVDSLLNGKSKFLAEVDRLRQAIESALQNRPVLFLVDEIFGGTNSRDRRIAAEAVVGALVGRGAIGALSTHDLALTEIASAEGMNGVNVHMGSRAGGDPMKGEGDPLDFDYRLKPGATTETNALAIARMAGVPV